MFVDGFDSVNDPNYAQPVSRYIVLIGFLVFTYKFKNSLELLVVSTSVLWLKSSERSHLIYYDDYHWFRSTWRSHRLCCSLCKW